MKLRITFLLVAIATGAFFGAVVEAQTAKDSAKIKWNLRDVCRDVRLDQNTLAFEIRESKSPLAIQCQDAHDTKTEAALESIPAKIPFASIVTIVREEVIRKPVQEEINKTLYSLQPENIGSTIGEAGDAGLGALATPVVLLAQAGALAPFRGIKKHLASVRVIWMENGKPRSVGMVLSPKDAESMLQQLKQATGKNWSEVRFDTDARNKRNLELVVHLNKMVNIGDVTVFGGTYKFLVVETSDSTRLIYIFHEGYKSLQDAMMVLTATPLPLGSGNPWKLNLVPAADDSYCLSEIDTDSERLLLSICGERGLLYHLPIRPSNKSSAAYYLGRATTCQSFVPKLAIHPLIRCGANARFAVRRNLFAIDEESHRTTS